VLLHVGGTATGMTGPLLWFDPGDRVYESPEAAALAEWDRYPDVEVTVIIVRYEGRDRAVVVTDTVPSHPMKNFCVRTKKGWVYTADCS
jgi:hypothetical protein